MNLLRPPLKTGAIVLVAGGLVAALLVPGLGASSQPSGTPDGFVAVAPTRVLDTRTPPVGIASGTPVGPGATVVLPLTTVAPNRAGVPVPPASVLLNVTVDADATANSFITVWPTGDPRPTTSVINPKPGTVVFGSILVPLGAGGDVSIFNFAGNVNVIVDLEVYTLPISGGGVQGPAGPTGPTGPQGIQGPPGPAVAPLVVFNSAFGLEFLPQTPTQAVATKAAVPVGTYLVESNLAGGFDGSPAGIVECVMLEGSTPLKDINGFNLRAIVNTDGVSLVSGNMHTGGVVTLASAAIVAVQCTANAEITLAGVDLATLYLVPIGSVS